MKKLLVLLFLSLSLYGYSQEYNLMPYPESVSTKTGEPFKINKEVRFVLKGAYTSNAKPYFQRAIKRLSNRTALFFDTIAINEKLVGPVIEITSTKKGEVKFQENESYTLLVTEKKVTIKGSEIACYRGLETLLQLIDSQNGFYFFPAIEIQDSSRFPWRGLMIDACRHFVPVEVIKRNLDAMASAKMNVFHWHLTEDQAFRIECKAYPKLHQLGNNGDYYTQIEVKDIVKYASSRGIRVVPEFDIPGHATSWCVAYPEFCSKKMDYVLEENYGIFDPTLDPTNEETYVFLKTFLGEMSALFPDEYMHIGGDENKGKDWNENTKIQEFKKANQLEDNHELQAYFNRKVLAILRANGKKMMGWDEIYHKSIPKEIVIQSWRGKESLYEVAKAGYPGILSNGYYLDMVYSAEKYYLNDPLPKNNELGSAQKKLIYGGEATMWSELVSEETIDSRIWPVTLAIAERYWLPQEVNDVDNMYQRLNVVSKQLEEHGLCHLKNQRMLFSRLCNYQKNDEALLFIQLLEPLKGYERHRHIKFKTNYPLSRLADVCYTESMETRKFRLLVKDYKEGKLETQVMVNQLVLYKESAESYIRLSQKAPAMIEGVPLAKDLIKACDLTLFFLLGRGHYSSEELIAQLEHMKKTKMDCELVVLGAFEYLVEKED